AVLDTAFATARRVPDIACEATYMMTAVAMVRAGLGVTILPVSAREAGLEPDLLVLPIDDPELLRPVALIKKRGRTLPPVTETFVAALIAMLDCPAESGQAASPAHDASLRRFGTP
ncbi:MAG: LysR substrate-binding domain-containing protein, partial [Janthinobacterium lividum]